MDQHKQTGLKTGSITNSGSSQEPSSNKIVALQRSTSCNRLPGYDYRKASSIKGNEALLFTDTYTFRNRFNEIYIVNVEKYMYHMYVVKFYRKSERSSDLKYNYLTHKHDARRIINTCLNITLCLYESDPIASFGFKASQTLLDKRQKLFEPEANNKRFRIYAFLMRNYFKEDHFVHGEVKAKSSYLLMNKKNTEPELFGRINEMFNNYYVLNA